jgi:hypothetical protein
MNIRNCPKCNSTIIYKSKYRCDYAEKEKCVCKKCMHKNKTQKELYGDRFDEIIKKRSISLKKVNHWWHDKIAETKRKNGTNRLSDEHKEKISKNTIFSKTGSEHVGIKKILKECNITYDEYLSKMTLYERYKRDVMNLTKRINVTKLENFEKRGKAGKDGAYHLDHIIEISEGYVNNLPIEEIANINNLQFITWQDNMKKRKYPYGILKKDTL